MSYNELEQITQYGDLPAENDGNPALSESVGARSSTPEGDQKAPARSSRAQAESVRQNIAAEVLGATRVVYQKLISDGQAFLETALLRQALAEEMHLEALKALAEAEDTREQAIAFEEKIIKESNSKAKDILNRARADAERECEDLRDRAKLQVQQLLDDAEAIKAAAQEELQVQAIYAEASRLEAEAHEVLAKAKARLAQGERSRPTTRGVIQPEADTDPDSLLFDRNQN